jgi:F-type H+-transporting ATPase subunit a
MTPPRAYSNAGVLYSVGAELLQPRQTEKMAVSAPVQPRSGGSALTIGLAVLGLVVVVAGALGLPVKLAKVEITASPIAHIGSYPVTNSWLTGWISLLVLVILFGLATRSMKLVPTGLQNLGEAVIGFLLDLAENVAGKAKGREFFALFATIFLYVVVNNWLELFPGFTNATIFVRQGEEQVGLFRSPSADLNFTVALALSAVFMVQFWSVKHTGWRGWASKFINLKGGPIGFVVGILETISELARVISFSFRLFGNLFAGEVLLSVIPSLIPLVIVIPFLALELFVGVIQALIFALLTLAFTVMATISHGGTEHGH